MAASEIQSGFVRAASCASAPGTLMLMGEHAVLRGAPALVCAVDRRITARVAARPDDCVSISSALACAECRAGDWSALPPSLRFVRGALASFAWPKHPSGFSIGIDADFPGTIGLGSSSAVTTALVAALRSMRGESLGHDALFEQAYGVIRSVQGTGSGADVAASILGGVTRYRMAPREMTSVKIYFPLTVVYCGYKRPTAEVIEIVNRAEKEHPEEFASHFRRLAELAGAGWDKINEADWAAFGALMNEHQAVMENMGLCTRELREIIAAMRASPWALGAKISGSGLGDCALALGEGPWPLQSYEQISTRISARGVEVDDDPE